MLVLDDFLAEIRNARRQFAMRGAPLDWSEMEQDSAVRVALDRLVAAGVKHRTVFATLRNELLAPLGEQIYGELLEEMPDRVKIAPDYGRSVLRTTFHLGIDTVVRLPAKDPKPKKVDLRALSSALAKLAEKLSAAGRDEDVRQRMDSLRKTGVEVHRLEDTAKDMTVMAANLHAAAARKLTRIRLGSPNPQVRFAMYLADWVTACTQRPHYALLTTLLEAGFAARELRAPAWTGRLEIEMNLKRRLRRKWAQMLRQAQSPAS